MKDGKPRRLGRLYCTPELLLNFFLAGGSQNVAFSCDLPGDAKFVDAGWSDEKRAYVLIVESETLPVVQPGYEIPEITATMKAVSQAWRKEQSVN